MNILRILITYNKDRLTLYCFWYKDSLLVDGLVEQVLAQMQSVSTLTPFKCFGRKPDWTMQIKACRFLLVCEMLCNVRMSNSQFLCFFR